MWKKMGELNPLWTLCMETEKEIHSNRSWGNLPCTEVIVEYPGWDVSIVWRMIKHIIWACRWCWTATIPQTKCPSLWSTIKHLILNQSRYFPFIHSITYPFNNLLENTFLCLTMFYISMMFSPAPRVFKRPYPVLSHFILFQSLTMHLINLKRV